MANYNTFAVVESKHGKILLITSSARKANKLLCVGNRIEVWNNNEKIASYTSKAKHMMHQFIKEEKNYIRLKQEKATKRNALASRKEKNVCF